jgi:hypothetical protein
MNVFLFSVTNSSKFEFFFSRVRLIDISLCISSGYIQMKKLKNHPTLVQQTDKSLTYLGKPERFKNQKL